MSSQRPAFYFGGQAPNQHPPPPQNYAPVPPPANNTPIVPSQPQQMAFQQNAALPGIDLSALNGMNISAEQLMTIARLLQSGQLTLPPPAPGVNPTPSALPMSTPIPPPAAVQQNPAPIANGGNDVDMDREEGELEDDEQLSRADGLTSAASTSFAVDPVHVSRTQAVPEPATGASQPNMAVKAFVLELHRVGYTFEDLAREVGDSRALRNLYKQIDLPLPQVPPPTVVQRAAATGAQNIVATASKGVADREAPGKPAAVSVKAPATASSKPDRASYLAKLQAAKNKKSEPVVESPTSNVTQSPAVPAAMSTNAYPPPRTTGTPQSAARQQVSTPQHAVPTMSHPAAVAAIPQPNAPTLAIPLPSTGAARPTKVIVDTGLVRQRLAKLQAERAAFQNAHRSSNAPTPVGAQSQSDTQQAGLPSANPAQPQHRFTMPTAASTSALPSPVVVNGGYANPPPPPDSAAASPSLARGSGLPGLFTTRTPVQQTSPPVPPPKEASMASTPAQFQAQTQSAAAITHSPAYAPAPLNLPQQRPMNGERGPWNGSGAPKRPFGESRIQNEAFIIETSSDDDDGEDMDIEDSTGEQSPESEAKSLPGRPIGLLTDFPPLRSNSQKGTSTPGTPGGDLKRKMEEIEIAKQQLEDMELKRRKTVVKPARSMQAASTQSPVATLAARPGSSLPDIATPNSELGNQSPSTASNLSAQQQKELLRKRIQELQNDLGRNSPSASAAALPMSEASAQFVPEHPEDQSSAAADADDGDDGDLYEPEPVEHGETAASAVHVESQDFDDDDGEIYEPQDLDTTGDAETRLQLGSDSGRVGSQATTQSGTTNADAADTQLNVEMDAAMAHDAGLNNGITTEDHEPAISALQQSDSHQIGQDLKHGGAGSEEGEFADDDSEDLYESTMKDRPISPPMVNTTTTPADALELEQEEDEEDGNQPMDISDDSDSDSESDSSDESSDEYEPEQNIIPEPFDLPESPGVVQDPGTKQSDEILRSSTQDDAAPELQPAVEQPASVVEPEPTGFYTPYTSVLSRFKEFRYHPEFLDTVPGGHKSLTYSNKIDLDKPICQFEVGGRCNDKDCEFQHFRTMTLSDNDLLREIGTRKIPAKGAEEERAWREGLTGVITKLRETNSGKDVAVIAQRISEFRREFRGDPSKTLMLD